jgi:hypothetical protein
MIPTSLIIDHEYHIVELHRYSQNAIDWCSEKFGPIGGRWFYHNHKICFKDPQDHLMFLLRWA